MTKWRLICCANENGECTDETVYFADADDTTPASDFVREGQSITFDGIIEANLPSVFPINYFLERQ